MSTVIEARSFTSSLTLPLATAGPLAIGAIVAARAHDATPIATVPAIVFGVLAATSPALYIAIAATGDAPPLARVARALAAALGAFGVALAGLVLPVAFLSLSSLSPLTMLLVCSGALAGAGLLALRRLVRELALRSALATGLIWVWGAAVVGIAGRLWLDLVKEVFA
jgi:hypothetical protein